MFCGDFAAAEFAERRGRVPDAIGPTGVAVLQGAASPLGQVRFRQTNSSCYLIGAETPRACLLLRGRSIEETRREEGIPDRYPSPASAPRPGPAGRNGTASEPRTTSGR